MLATPRQTRARHHRTLTHAGRSARRVPIEHVTGSVAVPVREARPAPAPTQPEWRTDAWKQRVEAEALHRLEDRLRGPGGVH